MKKTKQQKKVTQLIVNNLTWYPHGSISSDFLNNGNVCQQKFNSSTWTTTDQVCFFGNNNVLLLETRIIWTCGITK